MARAMHAGTVYTSDVTVIGGGLAGMAASLHLAKAGLRVVCIEPETSARQPVGESLDWASPGLLDALGLPMEDLIRSRDRDLQTGRHSAVKRGTRGNVSTSSVVGPSAVSTSSCVPSMSIGCNWTGDCKIWFCAKVSP
jgi:2-polyprenyl-6-methoxyphenol hydroxylase-like FAD-dependent oxidoreductase